MDRLKQILEKIKEFWLKFNRKQHVVFIVAVVLITVAIVVAANLLTRTKTVTLRSCSSESEAVEVRTLLNDNDISCTIDSDNVVNVNEDDYVEAKLVLGSNNISSDGYSLSDAVDSSFTTTASDKEKKYKAYLESKFEDDLETIDGVKSARVTIDFADDSSNIFTEDTDSSITAILNLTHDLDDGQAEAIGLLLATNVGSDNTNNVVVLDGNAEVLYYGGKDSSYGTSTSSQKVQTQLENAIIAKAKQLLIATGLYTDATVSPNLSVDFSDTEIVKHEYSAPEGTDEGLYSHSYVVNSTGAIDDASGTAGTESNDEDTDYEIQNSDGSTSEYSLSEYDWLQDEVITTTTAASGTIDYDNSSISIVVENVTELTEEDAENQGLLDDMTWDEFKNANKDPVALTVDEQFTEIVSKGTGIPTESISIIGYSSYRFYDAEEESTSPWTIIQIVLAVLIAALLIFIIIRSTRPVAVAETEPELSVEDMLATTKENRDAIEDIDVKEKSETRIAIEKFVDENPEAVAVLLRNWLNDGWN